MADTHTHDDGTTHSHDDEPQPILIPEHAQATPAEILKVRRWECFMRRTHLWGMEEFDPVSLAPIRVVCTHCQEGWPVAQ